MRIKYHYCIENKRGLIKLLDEFQVPYELCHLPEINSILCSFDLYEDQEVYRKFRKKFFISKFDTIKSIEYSKREIESAEWLSVRNGSIKVQWEYEENAFRESCPYKRPFVKEVYYRHIEQVGVLAASKKVKWGTRQYFYNGLIN